MSDDAVIWGFLKDKGLSDFAAAGVMGNLYAESGLIPNNLQNTFEASLQMTDAEYTAAVDNGSYGNFVRDAAGYGLAQWTFWSRKDGLLKMARSMGRSVGNLTVQLNFLWSELQEFGLVGKLNACGSVRDASNVMLFEFEKPLDMGKAVQDARASWSQGFYDRFHGSAGANVPVSGPVGSDVRNDFMYSVIAFGSFNDLDIAKARLANLRGYGFDGIVVAREV